MSSLLGPDEWVAAFTSAAEGILTGVAGVLPRILAAILILLLGWGFAIGLRRVTKRFLSWTGIAAALERDELKDILSKAGIAARVDELLSGFVYWATILLFLLSATETLGWTVLSNTLRDLFAYLPHVVGALAVLVLAILVSKPVFAVVSAVFSQLDLPFKETFARSAAGLAIFIGFIVAVGQIGIDLSFFTTNIHFVVVGIVAIFVLSLGLGSRTIVANLLAGFYTKQIYSQGQEVFVANQRATVKSINDVCVIFSTDEGDLVVPNDQLMSKS